MNSGIPNAWSKPCYFATIPNPFNPNQVSRAMSLTQPRLRPPRRRRRAKTDKVDGEALIRAPTKTLRRARADDLIGFFALDRGTWRPVPSRQICWRGTAPPNSSRAANKNSDAPGPRESQFALFFGHRIDTGMIGRNRQNSKRYCNVQDVVQMNAP